MTPTTFDILVLAGRCRWPAHILSGQMINPNATSWRARVESARPHELEELHGMLTAKATEQDRFDAVMAETDRRIEAKRRAFDWVC